MSFDKLRTGQNGSLPLEKAAARRDKMFELRKILATEEKTLCG